MSRYKRAGYTAVTNALAKLMGLAIFFAALKKCAPIIGTDNFGMIISAVTLITIGGLLDFGIANSFVNKIANEINKSANGNISLLITRSIILSIALGLTSLLIYTPLALAYDYFNPSNDIHLIILSTTLLVPLSIFSSCINKIYFGLQKGYISGAVQLILNFAAFFLLILWPNFFSNKTALITLLTISQTASGLFLAPTLARRYYFKTGINIKSILFDLGRSAKDGKSFFVIQIGALFGLAADPFLVGEILNYSMVTIYATVQKVMQVITQPFAILNQPLWASYADAYSAKDIRFIKKTFSKSLLISLAGSATLSLIVYTNFNSITNSMSVDQGDIPVNFVAIYCLWAVIEVCGNCFSMLKNGSFMIREQATEAILFVSIGIIFKLILGNFFGLTGFVIALIAAYITSNIITYLVIFNKSLNDLFRN